MNKKEYMSMSLPYGLMIGDEELNEFPMLTGIDYQSDQCLAIHGDSGESDIDSVMPICFPLDYLTKEIQIKDYNNGKKFIPIVHLFNICYGEKLKKSECLVFFSDDMYQLKFSGILFGFDILDFSFTCAARGEVNVIPNMLQLFQQLIKWHFAVGLNENEFIPVTEEFNPYK